MDTQFSETKTVQVRNEPAVIDRVNARNVIICAGTSKTGGAGVLFSEFTDYSQRDLTTF